MLYTNICVFLTGCDHEFIKFDIEKGKKKKKKPWWKHIWLSSKCKRNLYSVYSSAWHLRQKATPTRYTVVKSLSEEEEEKNPNRK